MRFLIALALLFGLLIFGCAGGEQPQTAPHASQPTQAQSTSTPNASQEKPIGLSAALSSKEPYECAKDGNFSGNILRVMDGKLKGKMQYSEQIRDAIYLLDSRVLYFGEKTGMVDENGTNRSYDWEKIDFNKEDEILRAVGMDPKDPELTSAVKPPVYVFGDEASYICRKATFGAGIFTPTGNVLDVSGETEKAFNNLVNALEKRGSNLSDMSNTFQGLIETINKTNGTEIK